MCLSQTQLSGNILWEVVAQFVFGAFHKEQFEKTHATA
jgi:hypothetical protein